MNPFTLKELRQLTRSRTISGALMFFLFVSVFVTYVIPLYGLTRRTGQELFTYISLSLSLIFLLVLPVNVFIRLMKERGGRHTADLTLLTPLTPRAIIDGKLCSAFTQMFLFTAAALPFCVAAYLFHGVTFSLMLKVLLGVVASGALAVSMTLVIGSFRCAPVFRIVGFGFFMLPWGCVLFGELVGMFMEVFGSLSWGRMLVVLAVFATAVLIARAFAIAVMSPKVMERDRILRVTVLVATVGWMVYMLVNPWGENVIDWRKNIVGHTATFTFIILVLVVWAMVQDVGYSARQLAELPQQAWRRAGGWLFRSGAVNGLVFALLLGLAVASILPILQPYFDVEIKRYVQESEKLLDMSVSGITLTDKPRSTSIFVFFAYACASLLYARALWYAIRRRVCLPTIYVPFVAMMGMLLWQTIPSALKLSGMILGTSDLPFYLDNHNLGQHSSQYVLRAGGALVLGLVAMLPEFIATLRQRRDGNRKQLEENKTKEEKVDNGMVQA